VAVPLELLTRLLRFSLTTNDDHGRSLAVAHDQRALNAICATRTRTLLLPIPTRITTTLRPQCLLLRRAPHSRQPAVARVRLAPLVPTEMVSAQAALLVEAGAVGRLVVLPMLPLFVSMLVRGFNMADTCDI
jgi:hypothetical protein